MFLRSTLFSSIFRRLKAELRKLAVIGMCGIFFIGFSEFFSHTFQFLQPQNNVPKRHILLGAWTQGFFDSTTQTLHPEKLFEFQQLIHKSLSIAHYYRGWEAFDDPKLISEFNTLHGYGWTPMLNVNPYFFPECQSSKPLYKAIADGDCDAFLHKAGQNLQKISQPFYLLFAWEMNNKDNSWSVIHSGSTSQDFVNAWRHIYTIFKSEHTVNIQWVFCPNTQDSTSISYDELYPGDEYVNWVGLDGYNWGTSQAWSQWSSFSGIFGSSYTHIVQTAPNKPVMIAEVNTTNQGGDKGKWYEEMFTKEIPEQFPKIQAVVIYNEDRTVQEHVNWNINVSNDSMQGFITGVHSGYY